MTAKEYLSQAYRIDQQINCKLEQIHSLRSLAEKATSTLTDTPTSGTHNVNRMEEIITKMVDLEAEVNSDIDALLTRKKEITAVIKGVANADYRMLLELRYLCFKPWEYIATEMEYNRDYIFILHRAALSAINEIYFSHHQ